MLSLSTCSLLLNGSKLRQHSITVVVCMLLHLIHSCLCTTIGRPRSSGSVVSSECHLVVLLDAQPVAGKPA